MPSGAANGLATGHTHQSLWALEGASWGLRNMWQRGAPAAKQPMWTPDTHASVPEPASK